MSQKEKSYDFEEKLVKNFETTWKSKSQKPLFYADFRDTQNTFYTDFNTFLKLATQE